MLHSVLPALLATVLSAGSAAEERLFPFVISYDAPDNATNVSSWLHRPGGQSVSAGQSQAAGKFSPVRVEQGHLATDAGPIRLWSTNLCFDACFPTHDEAGKLAGRLARLGINCVRMHHMDSHSIWGDSPNHLTLDPKRLERLDYLVYQLKRQGIYVNLNLHVSRWFDVAEGFVGRQSRPEFDKGLDNFEPRMIALQKKYAHDLLTHVNPYVRRPYTGEPAVAFVEISNEDALYAVWGWGKLDTLGEPYASTFRKLWNGWLLKKYGTTAKLRKAWNLGAAPLGSELLADGDFSRPLPGPWILERDPQTQAEWSVGHDGPSGGNSLRIVVVRQGEVSWHPQLVQSGFAVKKDVPYTLAFQVRADKARRISVNCMMAHAPWERLGLSADVQVQTRWRAVRLTFVAERDDAQTRISFTGFEPGTCELADISLRPGGVAGLEPGQTLEEENVPVLLHNEMRLTRAARRDFADFLWDTERDYWWGMYRYVKEELGVRAVVIGTQLGYSPVHVQAGLDSIDNHSYWNHPVFPNRPWDMNDWYVTDTALVNVPGGTLSHLASARVAGKPYTVSEYNHPQPIEYAAEGFPMIAAFGAFQGWDAIYSFAYAHNASFQPRRIESFFDIKTDTAKLAHMPACAALFVRGDAAPARKTIAVPMSLDAERRQLHETLNSWSLTAGTFGLDPRFSLLHGIALDLGGTSSGELPKFPADHPPVFVSDTGQLRWDLSQPGAGYFTADTPRTKLFTGFVHGRSFSLGDVTLRIGPTRLDWATVSLVAVDGKGFDQPGRILIAATGLVHNRGTKIERLGGERITLHRDWGEGPVLCEGIPAEIVLPVAAGRVQWTSLDESGNHRTTIPVTEREGNAVLELNPKYKTVWYEARIR